LEPITSTKNKNIKHAYKWKNREGFSPGKPIENFYSMESHIKPIENLLYGKIG